MDNFADLMQRPLRIPSGENNCGMLTAAPRTPRCEAYRFDCFEVSLKLGTLLQRGERLRVQALPFKMLVALLERPGELLTKEELADRLWGQEIFTEIDQSLYVMAGKLRQVLGDDASQPRFIKTDSGKGYRFIASVTPVFAPVSERSAPLSLPAEQTELTVKRTSRLAAFRLLAVVIVAALGTGLAAYKYEHRALMNDHDGVVVAGIANSTGNADLDGTFSSALQSQLEQSPYLNLISDTNFRALIKSPESASLQDELRACVKLEGQVLLKGRISSLAQGYQVTLSAWRCASGRLLTTEKAVASSQATILPALDLAGESMRRRLGEPEASLRRFNVPTVQAATPSLAALRAFNLGEEKRFTGDLALAVASYKLALDLDPQFAIAYGRLGIVYYNTAQFVLSAQAFQRAFELRDTRTSDRERLFLITLYYRFATGQIKQTIEDYELWRALYPRDVAPIHNLAAQYLSIGQPQRALDLARQAIQLEPTDDNHYELLAEAYLRLGDFANVKKMCEDPAHGSMKLMRFHLACFEAAFGQNDEVAMNGQLQWAHGNPQESEALDDSAWAAMYFGRISDARVLFRKAKDSAVQNKSMELAAGIELDQGLLESDLGLLPAARTVAREVLKLPFEGASEQANVARVLARSGDTALALTIAKKAAGMAPLNDLINSTMLAMVRAAVYMQKADPARAVEALEESREFELCSCMQLAPSYYRGLAYLQNNQPELALRQFQQIIDHRFLAPPFSVYLVLSQLELGHAYQLLGDSTSANSAFAKVEMVWKDADRNFPPLQKLRHYQEQHMGSKEQYIASRESPRFASSLH